MAAPLSTLTDTSGWVEPDRPQCARIAEILYSHYRSRPLENSVALSSGPLHVAFTRVSIFQIEVCRLCAPNLGTAAVPIIGVPPPITRWSAESEKAIGRSSKPIYGSPRRASRTCSRRAASSSILIRSHRPVSSSRRSSSIPLKSKRETMPTTLPSSMIGT